MASKKRKKKPTRKQKRKAVVDRSKAILRSVFVPTYDELSLLLMGAGVLLILVLNHSDVGELTAAMWDDIELKALPGLIMFTVAFLGGLFLSIYHSLVRREKPRSHRALMLVFAVMLQVASALIGGAYALANAASTSDLIFPIWNIANGLLLVILARLDVLDFTCVDEGDASPLQVAAGIFVAVVLVLFGHFGLGQSWWVTLSMTVAVGGALSRGLEVVVRPGKAGSRHNNAFQRTPGGATF